VPLAAVPAGNRNPINAKTPTAKAAHAQPLHGRLVMACNRISRHVSNVPFRILTSLPPDRSPSSLATILVTNVHYEPCEAGVD
jgi:hypothetical protein